jgi:signal transduction histidine kinase
MVTEGSGSVAAGSSGTESSPTRIVPVLSSTGNQRVLVDWLQQQSQYEALSDGHPGLPDSDFDMVIIDDRSLREFDAEIRERKANTEAFLPVLLVRPDAAVDTLGFREQAQTASETETDGTVWQVVDEILTAPIAIAELRRRLTTLTRIRAQSLALERKTDQLLLLNRVTHHDIQNEMNLLMGLTASLEAHTDDAGAEICQRVLDSSQNVVDLMRVVREFGEILETDGKPDPQAINLADVLTDQLTKHRSTFDGAEFVVTGEIPRVQVCANDLLASVFRNLLKNAVQHNDADTPRVEITVQDDDRTVTVTIADNGPGIAPDQRDAVLCRTERGLDHPAAGIGLYLVETLVDQYGGTLRLTDSELTGVAVEVELLKESATGASERS